MTKAIKIMAMIGKIIMSTIMVFLWCSCTANNIEQLVKKGA